MLKAQRIQIGLDEMVIRHLQQQIYQKEQNGKRQGLLTTLATIATELVFVEVVKEIEKAVKAKKAKKEARQEASTRRKHSTRKGKSVSKALEEMSILSVQAPHTRWGVVCRNYCEDSDSDYMP